MLLWNLAAEDSIQLALSQNGTDKNIEIESLKKIDNSVLKNNPDELQNYLCNPNAGPPVSNSGSRACPAIAERTHKNCVGLGLIAGDQRAFADKNFNCLRVTATISQDVLDSFVADTPVYLKITSEGQPIDPDPRSTLKLQASFFTASASGQTASQDLTQYPLIERIGFTRSGLFTWQAGFPSGVLNKRIGGLSVTRQIVQPRANTTLFMDYQATRPNQTVAFSLDSVVVLERKDDMNGTPVGFPVLLCAPNTAMKSSCRTMTSTPYTNGLPPGALGLQLSPDGKRLVFADGTGKLSFAEVPDMGTSLTWTQVPASPPSGVTGVQLALGDLNGDGRADLVSLSSPPSSRQLEVFTGNETGFRQDPTLSAGLTEALKLSGNPNIAALAMGDLDADGRADVAVYTEGRLSVLLSPNGKERAGFTERWSTTLKLAAGTVERVALEIGDADGDAKNDLVLAVTTRQGSVADALYIQSLFAFFK